MLSCIRLHHSPGRTRNHFSHSSCHSTFVSSYNPRLELQSQGTQYRCEKCPADGIGDRGYYSIAECHGQNRQPEKEEHSVRCEGISNRVRETLYAHSRFLSRWTSVFNPSTYRVSFLRFVTGARRTFVSRSRVGVLCRLTGTVSGCGGAGSTVSPPTLGSAFIHAWIGTANHACVAHCCSMISPGRKLVADGKFGKCGMSS